MNREDVIRMAREAGLAFNFDDYPDFWQTHMDVGREEIERFAALVAAAEREACAKVCEARAGNTRFVIDAEAKRCAAAIRARGQEPPR